MSSATGSDSKHVRADRGQGGTPDAVEPRRDGDDDVRGNNPGYVDDTSSYPVHLSL